MKLTEQEKQIAWVAFMRNQCFGNEACIYAAVEAVLAQRQPAQPEVQPERGINENQADVCMVRPVGRSFLGQEEQGAVPVSAFNARTQDRVLEAQPAPDVVERMALAIKEHHTDYHPTLNDYRVMATAAAQVLLDERDKQWEQAIIWGCTNVDWDSTPERFLKLVRARLSAKPPQQETREQQVTAILQATVKETNEKWFEAAEKVARVREEK